MSIRVVAVVNGIHAAFGSVGRNRDGSPRVCTSISIYIIQNGKIVYHVLIDCGPGVPSAVMAQHRFPNRPPDLLILTHAHADHCLGIDELIGSLRRQWAAGPGGISEKLKLLCLRDTFDHTVHIHFPYLEPFITHVEAKPMAPFALWKYNGTELRVTLVEVKHFRHSCVPVFEFIQTGHPTTKLITLFDIGEFYLPGSSQADAGATALNPLFANAAILIAEANTWTDPEETSGKPTGHINFRTLAHLIQTWMPQRTRILHYGAYEDALGSGRPEHYWGLVQEDRCIHPSEGPTSAWELTAAMQEYMHDLGYPDPYSVSAAYQSETLMLAPHLPSDELLVRVRIESEKLVIAGSVGRRTAHEHGVPHTTVLLLPYKPGDRGKVGQLLVHRRSPCRQVSPRCLDFLGGHVNFAGPLQSPEKWHDLDVLNEAVLRTAIREATEEMRLMPEHLFKVGDFTRLGEIGEFAAGLDHPGQGNVEYSTVYLVRLPAGAAVKVCDTTSVGEQELEADFATLADLLQQYLVQPEEFADGAARILKRISENSELRQTVSAILDG